MERRSRHEIGCGALDTMMNVTPIGQSSFLWTEGNGSELGSREETREARF